MATTASERLIGTVGAFLTHLEALSPQEVAMNGALSGLVVLAAFGLLKAGPWLTRRSLGRLPSKAAAKRIGDSLTMRVIDMALRVALGLLALYLLLLVWGIDLFAWASTGGGAAAGREVWRLCLLALIAAGAFELVGYAIGRAMDRLAKSSGDARRAAQLRTLLPLLRGIFQAAVVVIAVLTVLSDIGVKIAPLLAGAGVVGVAIGFGAQNLVKDFLTGLFLVLEDVVAVGDTVEVAGFRGRVEAMTLRTIRLRDFDGTLHIFPYSEAPVIHNATNLFAYAVIDVQVKPEADVDKAIEVMRKTGEALAAEPETAGKVLQPIEVLGVDSLGASGVHLKGRIKTLPTARAQVARAYYRRLKPALDAAGIALA